MPLTVEDRLRRVSGIELSAIRMGRTMPPSQASRGWEGALRSDATAVSVFLLAEGNLLMDWVFAAQNDGHEDRLRRNYF